MSTKNTFKKLTYSFCIFALFASIGSSWWLSKTSSKLSLLSSGVDTCYQRVHQSFTAMVTMNVSSSFLAGDFMQATSSCLEEARRMSEQLNVEFLAIDYKKLNQMISDESWFQKKINRFKDLLENTSFNVSQSNFVSKFLELENVKIEFQDSLNDAQSSLSLWRNIAIGLSFAFSLIISFGLFTRSKELAQIANRVQNFDLQAKKVMNSSDLDKTESLRLFENIFNSFEMPRVLALFNENKFIDTSQNTFHAPKAYVEPLQSKKLSTSGDDDYTNIDTALVTFIESETSQLHSKGVKLAIDIDPTHNIKIASKTFELVLKRSMDFFIEEGARHFQFESRQLAGSTILSLRTNEIFELEKIMKLNSFVISDQMPGQWQEVKKLAGLTNFGVSLKNSPKSKHIQMEMVFETSQARKKQDKKNIRVLKGKKKDILKELSSRA